jgi:hypothetical protein
MTRRALSPLLLALALAVAGPSPALAKHGGGGPDVRAAGTCGKGATSKLRLRPRDGGIELRFEVEHARSGAAWRIVVVQERRVVWRGRARTARGAFEIGRRLADLPGADHVSVRGVGPRGLTCVAAATLPG